MKPEHPNSYLRLAAQLHREMATDPHSVPRTALEIGGWDKRQRHPRTLVDAVSFIDEKRKGLYVYLAVVGSRICDDLFGRNPKLALGPATVPKSVAVELSLDPRGSHRDRMRTLARWSSLAAMMEVPKTLRALDSTKAGSAVLDNIASLLAMHRHLHPEEFATSTPYSSVQSMFGSGILTAINIASKLAEVGPSVCAKVRSDFDSAEVRSAIVGSSVPDDLSKLGLAQLGRAERALMNVHSLYGLLNTAWFDPRTLTLKPNRFGRQAIAPGVPLMQLHDVLTGDSVGTRRLAVVGPTANGRIGESEISARGCPLRFSGWTRRAIESSLSAMAHPAIVDRGVLELGGRVAPASLPTELSACPHFGLSEPS